MAAPVHSAGPARPAVRIDAPRGLGVVDASLLVIGSIVGAGIFLVSPYVAQSVRSPAAFILAWLLGGAVALAGALSNGELGGLFPRSGGEYVYLREAYGPLFGFLSGWTAFWIAFPGSIAALAGGFGARMASVLGMSDPHAGVAIGVMAICALTAVNALGLRAGKWVQNGLSATKLAAFAALLILGALVPRTPCVDGCVGSSEPLLASAGGDSVGGVAVALVPVLFAYSGWNAATYVAGEMRDAARGLGRALALGTCLCIALYVAVNLAYLRAMSVAELAAASDPSRVTAVRLGGPAAAALLGPLVGLCVLSSLQATVLVGPRIYQAMASDGLFFAPLARVHSTLKTPLVALGVQAVVAVVELATGTFDELLTFAMFAIVFFSTLTVAAVFVLRARLPNAPRVFRVPGYPWVPGLFVAVNLWVMWNVVARGAQAALVGTAIVVTGVPVYALFRAWKRPPETV